MITAPNIYQDIATRTGGDIYIGVVGPVRTGKSTFIKKFMEELVIPNIDNEYVKDRSQDELPQSAAGKTIMTTEPKFIPEKAVALTIDNNINFKVRLIDCVGYVVPSALGHTENDQPRMVMSPWAEEAMPFNKAAEIGTEKVIKEHSTIGLVITTDGSIGDIPREDYVEAEKRVIKELKEINKPFVVILNTVYPKGEKAKELAASMQEEYGVPVMPIDCLSLSAGKINAIMQKILFEFPIQEIKIHLSDWVAKLSNEHYIKASIFDSIATSAAGISKIREIDSVTEKISQNEDVTRCEITNVFPGTGSVVLSVKSPKVLFYKVLGETTGIEVKNDGDLITVMSELAKSKTTYDKLSEALDEADARGYGIVSPASEQLSLEEPQIIKQGNRYGVKLKASAPSYHIIKADIETEVSPIVGSEKQSEELVQYMLDEFEEDPKKIWESNIFGKSVYSLVNEGLNTKLNKMPYDARDKVKETLEKIINEGSNGLICIIL